MSGVFLQQVKESFTNIKASFTNIKAYMKDNNLTLPERIGKIFDYHSKIIRELQKEIVVIEDFDTLIDILYQNITIYEEVANKYPNLEIFINMINEYYTLWSSLIERLSENNDKVTILYRYIYRCIVILS